MKNIIITGASRGIGLEIVRQFRAVNCNVLALSRNCESLLALNQENCTALSFDITDENDIEKVQKFIDTKWNKVDILIHNAGYLVNKPFLELTKSDFSYSYDVNVFGVARLTQVVLPYMDTTGHIVGISSIGGVQGSVKFPGLAAYSSSKGALITLFELLAEEYKEKGPACNVLALGAVQTEMLEEAFPGYKANQSAASMASYILEFSQNGQKYYNGKILEVSNTTP